MPDEPIIWRDTRDEAVVLLEGYLAGRISGEVLRTAWPKDVDKVPFDQLDQCDGGLIAVRGRYVSYIPKGRLTDIDWPDEQARIRETIERCRLFLLSEIPYQWSWHKLVSKWRFAACFTLSGITAGVLFHVVAILTHDKWLAELVAWTAGIAMGCLWIWLFIGRRLLAFERDVRTGLLPYWPFENLRDLETARQDAA